MSKTRPFLKYWLPVLIWMAVIFSASADTESVRHSSRIIGPLVRWLFPQLSEETVNLVVVVVRKCAHLTEYAILGLLFWRALRRPVKNDPRPWLWRPFGWSIVFVALYAITDEFHQNLVPGREGAIRDVLIDTLGGMMGLLAVWGIWHWRRRRQRPAQP